MGSKTSRAGLAEVLRRYGPAYLADHRLSIARAKVWRAILACRTAALGGHVEMCDACGTTRHVYHSCRNRHCPLCQTRAKEAWLAARRREVLPVPYFHLVFTLPHDLNGLIGQYPRALYEMLLGTVSSTLTEFAANPRWLGGTAAFTLVLHTWKQDLGRHVHAHALMAGGALGIDGQWVAAKRGFLFPVKALSKVFRGKFVAALNAARQSGKLAEVQLTEHAWRDLLARVHKHDWVVYAKEPLGGPAQVLDYLGRYTHRVAISNERILDIGADTVSVRVRDSTHGNRKRTLRLPAQTFIERFLLHVLPKGFKRIRHYGLIGPAHKAVRLAAARAALDAPAPNPLVVESVEAFMRRIDQHQRLRCPHCAKGQFVSMAPIAPVPLPLLHLRGPP
ncbi:MAG: transposase [Betaproteobacteria bacterium RIFCSPLOWO2_12_FULL_64_23]|nr:MAG: transposase [Betaproteobacteria bacterium RIFCSPLOWO2_12_FULL_64_23]